jgi:tRNA modification GTPase
VKANLNDPIIAIATPSGQGAIGVIRLSGESCIEILDKCFFGKNLSKVEGNTIHYGKIKRPDDTMVDECLVSIFRAPRSYTKEDSAEISCHGSPFILEEVVKLLIALGCRQAHPGEFTLRAFLNGQLDLSQAEAVADLIASENEMSHELALSQLRGGFSEEIKRLRQELIDFASLIELELDFGEEDVQFADRDRLIKLVEQIQTVISKLLKSFSYGNVVKKGVAVAIIGEPNVGKSTLLNALLNEDRAIVSDIAGTTRDVIEDKIIIEGIEFRFIDTAGLRETVDTIESIGIHKTKEQIEKASIVLFMSEISEDHQSIVDDFKKINIKPQQAAIILLNKIDKFHTCHAYDIEEAVSTLTNRTPCIAFSAKEGTSVDKIKNQLVQIIKNQKIADVSTVTNLRHFEALQKANEALTAVLNGINSGITGDFIAMDIRQSLHHLGEITGEINTDDLLDSIFTRFCIGK